MTTAWSFVGRSPDAAPNKWLVAAALTFGGLMGSIDVSIVNVALPTIRATFGATVSQVAWVSTGYAVALAMIMPLTAWFSSVFGRKTIYQVSLVLFTAASILAGMSETLPMLVTTRILQGFGAGCLMPVQQAILRETFPLEEQGLAMGLYGLVIMVGPAIGPTLGGWITDNFGWQWNFFINLPVGIIASLMVATYVPEPAYIKSRRTRVDLVGIGLLAVGLASILVVLEQGNSWDWFDSPLVWTLALVAGGCLTLFVLWELYGTDQPAVDLRILKNRSFAAGTAMGATLGMALFGGLFLLPLFLQQLLGYTALQSGLALMPRSLVMIMMMPFSGLLYNTVGPKILVGAGLLISASSMYLISTFTLDSTPEQILIPQITSGLGFALMFVSLSTASLSTIEKIRMTNATGLLSLARQLGGAFGTAIFATMLERGVAAQHARLLTHVNPYHPVFGATLDRMKSALVARGSDFVTAERQALAALGGLIHRQASVLSYEHVFLTAGLVLLLALPLLPFLEKGPIPRRR